MFILPPSIDELPPQAQKSRAIRQRPTLIEARMERARARNSATGTANDLRHHQRTDVKHLLWPRSTRDPRSRADEASAPGPGLSLRARICGLTGGKAHRACGWRSDQRPASPRTSTSTPTTVASAAPAAQPEQPDGHRHPASSKKFDVPISAQGRGGWRAAPFHALAQP